MFCAWLTVKQVLAAYPGQVGKTKLYEMVELGQLRSSKLGKLLIDTSSIDEYIAAQTKEPVPSVKKKPARAPAKFKHFSLD